MSSEQAPAPVQAVEPAVRRGPSYRRGMLLVTGASMMSPLVGLVTAPLITHALGAAGRGATSAVNAPNLFILGIATLGLPEAVAYHVAKRPALAKQSILWAGLFTLGAGLVAAAIAWVAAPALSAGDRSLVSLMRLCSVLALPGLLVSVLRGAAIGRQLWNLTALDRALGSTLKVLTIVTLALTHSLTIATVALTWCITPMLTAIVYTRVLFEVNPNPEATDRPTSRELRRSLRGFGSRVWLGDIATMMTARLAGLLVAPLSSLTQLGLLVVGNMISDVPYMLTTTVREVAFGANSAERNDPRLLMTSRTMLLVTLATCVPLGATLPWWIRPVFGADFGAAIVPTWLALLGTFIAIPGLIAGAGLSSVAKPQLRSAAIGAGLVVYGVLLVTLVPSMGATGAALAGLGSAATTTAGCVWASKVALGVRGRDFFLVGGEDLLMFRGIVGGLLAGLPLRRRHADG